VDQRTAYQLPACSKAEHRNNRPRRQHHNATPANRNPGNGTPDESWFIINLFSPRDQPLLEEPFPMPPADQSFQRFCHHPGDPQVRGSQRRSRQARFLRTNQWLSSHAKQGGPPAGRHKRFRAMSDASSGRAHCSRALLNGLDNLANDSCSSNLGFLRCSACERPAARPSRPNCGTHVNSRTFQTFS